MDISVKFSDNEVMPDNVTCNYMANLGVTKAVDVNSNKRELEPVNSILLDRRYIMW